MTPTRMSFVTAILFFLLIFGFSPLQSQVASDATPAGMHSIGDMVRQADADARKAALVQPDIVDLVPNKNHSAAAAAIHILYMHGMNAAGANDSALLRKGLCKYLEECNSTQLPRIYADSGPFAVDAPVPTLTYMQMPIWKTREEWNASTPFVDRYMISSPSHVPIILDELNWYPLVYALKCKWLIRPDASLTGPAKSQIDVCASIRKGVKGQTSPADKTHPGLFCVYNQQQGTQLDQDHSSGRYCAYEWISLADAEALKKLPRKAMVLNRSLKSGVMDWGFGDPVLVLGPMQEILTSGIRQLLVKSLEADGVNVANAKTEDSGPQFMFITHSLGSYLSLAALDSQWLGTEQPVLPAFGITTEETAASDYFSAHTVGFFFLANQVELLELARLVIPSGTSTTAAPPDPCTKVVPSRTTDAGAVEPAFVKRWQLLRHAYVTANPGEPSCPEIFAWSDPSDLLSWEVPEVYGVSVKNTQVRNPGWKKLPLLFAWPIDSHDNYAGNKNVLRAIFK